MVEETMVEVNLTVHHWPFEPVAIKSISLGKTIRKKNKTYFEVILNEGTRLEEFMIVRARKFLWMKFYSALYYGGSMNGYVTYDFFRSCFRDFEWAVENRCEKKWNGGECWMVDHDVVRHAIKYIKSLWN
jgi:hypothetical protein